MKPHANHIDKEFLLVSKKLIQSFKFDECRDNDGIVIEFSNWYYYVNCNIVLVIDISGSSIFILRDNYVLYKNPGHFLVSWWERVNKQIFSDKDRNLIIKYFLILVIMDTYSD